MKRFFSVILAVALFLPIMCMFGCSSPSEVRINELYLIAIDWNDDMAYAYLVFEDEDTCYVYDEQGTKTNPPDLFSAVDRVKQNGKKIDFEVSVENGKKVGKIDYVEGVYSKSGKFVVESSDRISFSYSECTNVGGEYPYHETFGIHNREYCYLNVSE